MNARADKEERRLKADGQMVVNYVFQNKSKGKSKIKNKPNEKIGKPEEMFFLWKKRTLRKGLLKEEKLV